MILEAAEHGRRQTTRRVGAGKLFAVLAFMVVLTWAPGLLLAMQKTVLADDDSGFVAVMFSPALADHAVFAKTLRAGGSLIRQTWLPNLWVVHSSQANFVARLKTQGAWFATDPAIFDLNTWLGCLPLAAK